VPVTVDEYAAAATAIMPADEARAMATLFAKVLDGRKRHSDRRRKAGPRPSRDGLPRLRQGRRRVRRLVLTPFPAIYGLLSVPEHQQESKIAEGWATR
jgi:hypothetical protein